MFQWFIVSYDSANKQEHHKKPLQARKASHCGSKQ